MIVLDSLNNAQRQAVTAPLGNLLVLAGAGSGKTRVLVHRIAWLLSEYRASPLSILAVTFTNKAAAEMRSRIGQLVPHSLAGMWVGTFHGLTHKLLRLHWKESGLPEHFQVLDADDQLQLIRRIFKTLAINEEHWEPKKAQGFINRKKDEGIRSHQLQYKGLEPYEQVLVDVYRQYEKVCEESGLVDFAELLLRSYELLLKSPETLAHYQSRFAHILVDEFQDTNSIQYQWLAKLAQKAHSITIVGDDDQSIYGWRGAKIENLYRFEKDFTNVTLIRLEQNYRSTQMILSAANALISHNDSRLGKTLWTKDKAGEPITLYTAFNEEDEALYVVRQIKAWLETGGSLDEVAILYRSNAQSRLLEEALIRAGIPYTIYGGLRFFERAEIKDALAYLRLAVNPRDNAAFERIINVPPRGIGERSLEKIRFVAENEGLSYWQAAQHALQERLIGGKAGHGLQTFIQIMQEINQAVLQSTLTQLIYKAIHQTGLMQYFRDQKGEKAQNRIENLEELVNATEDFMMEFTEEMMPITAFLSHASLEGGDYQLKAEAAMVQLMTLHSAKGLEFPVVFICGLEDGLFPHYLARETLSGIEEERRLCYVGITRAKQKLYLTHAEKRRLFGREELRRLSRFVREIPKELIEEVTCRVSVSWQPPDSWEFSQIEEGAFRLGQRVRHAKFGEGVVLDQDGKGDRARIHVLFDGYGSKWLALSYANLQPA